MRQLGFDSLRASRDFRLLWTASTVSEIGTQIVLLVLPLEVFRQTGSAFAIAVIWAAYLLPGAMFGVLGGVVADRWDKNQIMVVAGLAQAALVLLVLPVGFSHWLLLVIASAFFGALIGQISVLAEQGLVPQLVSPSHLMEANSLSAVGTQAARMIGPVLGGIVLTTWGFAAAVLIDCLSFAASALLIARVAGGQTPPQAPYRPTPSSFIASIEGLVAGTILSLRNRRVWSLLLVGGVGLLAGTAFQTTLVPFVIEYMGQSSAFLGTALGVRGLAAIIGGLLVLRIGAAVSPSVLLPMSLGLLGLGIMVLAFWPTPYIFVAFMLIAGPMIVTSGGSQRTLLQTAASSAYRGRVFGLSASSGGVLALVGALVGGIVAESLGPEYVVAGSGLLLVLIAGIGLRLIPQDGVDRQTDGNPTQ